MNITQEFGGGRYVIRGYDQNRVVVNDRSFMRSVIVAPEHLNPDWEPQSLAELKASHFEPVVALQPEVVLLGTGLRLQFPAQAIIAFLQQRAIAIEVMNTAAACRTFNLLVSQGRAVVGALLVH
ncbi:MAG TPA: Mth938-like domain-containing protein [Gammaproteobacteria bacterium]|nr:Mth938-like domain-containing protein [Gammaproteobacteria bacterium]